jgi:tetratricopeptide (TPR) repeat protein
MSDKKGSYSGAFITRYTLLTALLLAVVLLVASLTLNFTFSTIKETLRNNGVSYSKERALSVKLLIESADAVDTVPELPSDVVNAVLFKQGSDERRVVPVQVLAGNGEELLNTSGEFLDPENESLFLEAYSTIVVKPEIISDGKNHFHSTYFPVVLGDKRFIIQADISATKTLIQINKHASAISTVIKVLVFISIAAFFVLFFLAFHFFNGIQLFFQKLSALATDIVTGNNESKVSEADSDFSNLAKSFNTLVEELQYRKQKISELEKQNNMDELFKRGVSFLKKKRYDEAEHIFSTLTYLRPSSYGSFFNLGVIYAKENRYEESLGMFETALELNPGDALTESYCKKIRKHLSIINADEKIS